MKPILNLDRDEPPLYRIADTPGWVKQHEWDSKDETSHADYPMYHLLLDYQSRIEDGRYQCFRRTVRKINDASMLEEASLFLLELHPGNDQLVFHRVDIIRNGQMFSALSENSIGVYRREQRIENHITDGLETVSYSIDDLRVGDVIDFQVSRVTRAGDQPIWGKFLCNYFWLTWNGLLLQQRIRVINDSGSALKLHHHRIEDKSPVDTYETLAPNVTFDREYPNRKHKRIDDCAPAWIWSDFLQICTDTSWCRISRYFYRYYRESGVLGDNLHAAEIDRITLSGNQNDDALRIIRFVQNGIRFAGENLGVYTHTPKSPRCVLHRGAGDCKDKANLMIALLQSIGVQANLVLVNSDYGKGINLLNPSPLHLDHVMIRVAIDGEAYYFDSTAQKQAGDFRHAAQPDYGYALNLTETGEDLVELPYRISRKVYGVKHRFDLREAAQGNGYLTVTRKYQAHYADSMRYYLRANETRKIQRRYLGHAKDDTSLDLIMTRGLSLVKDDTRKNILVTREQYRIANLAQTHADALISIPAIFGWALPVPSNARFPVQIEADGVLEHRVEVLYSLRPHIPPFSLEISNRHFTYLDEARLDGKRLKFRIRVIPHNELVDQADIAQYKSDVESIQDRGDIHFPWQPETYEESTCWNALIVALLMGGLVAGILASA